MNAHGFRVYWTCWFIGWFIVGFLPVEIYCLIKKNGGTLSETIWWLEGYRPGQQDFGNILRWNAGHFLFSLTLTVVLVWLIGHFDFRIWH
jgi:hypothetical protein